MTILFIIGKSKFYYLAVVVFYLKKACQSRSPAVLRRFV